MTTHAMEILHSSVESDWRTPDPCFQALHNEFRFDIDAAAHRQNSHCGNFFFGPGSPIAPDAISHDWLSVFLLDIHQQPHFECGEVTETCAPRRFFLNPPYARGKAAQWNKAHPKQQIFNPFDIANWARKCWEESRRGATIVGLFPFAPQTDWYRRYVYGQGDTTRKTDPEPAWLGHAALQERRIPHRISFLTPQGEESNNAGVNTAVIVWQPMPRVVGPWIPQTFYWSYR